jgi:integrase
MRAGEILGLKGEYVYDDYLLVCVRITADGYRPQTKTNENRTIPLIPEMVELLRTLINKNGNGFVFSKDGGVKPVAQTTLNAAFKNALIKIGINKEEIANRRLSMHGWRHFLNTELQMQGLTISQVQSVTGHRSGRMTEHYSHLDPRKLTDIMKAQQAISGRGKTEGDKIPEIIKQYPPELHIVKTPEEEKLAQ